MTISFASFPTNAALFFSNEQQRSHASSYPSPAAPYNNVSGSMAWPGMRQLNVNTITYNNNNQAEWNWHRALDLVWNVLTPAERASAIAFARRWGPAAKPANLAPGTEQFFDAKFWRAQGGLGVPKCASCALSRGVIGPGALASIPILGLTAAQPCVPCLPCGCSYEEALFEQYMIGCGAWDRVQNDGRASAMGGLRSFMVAMYKQGLQIPAATSLTYTILADRLTRRAFIQRRLGGNEDAVQAWPQHY